jgi:hypothetical protein
VSFQPKALQGWSSYQPLLVSLPLRHPVLKTFG